MMLVHLDQLAPYQGTAQDEQREQWEVIAMRTKPLGRKVRLITDVTSTALGRKKWCYACRLFETNSLKEGAM
jgi:hypothetical protein